MTDMIEYTRKLLGPLCTCFFLLCSSYGLHGQIVNVDSRFLSFDISTAYSVQNADLVGIDDDFLYVFERGQKDNLVNVFSTANERDEPIAIISLDIKPDTVLSLNTGVLLVDFENSRISRLVYDSLQRDHVLTEFEPPEFTGGLRDVQLVDGEIFITAYDEIGKQHVLWCEKIDGQNEDVAWRTVGAYSTNETAVKLVKQQGTVFKTSDDGIQRLDEDSDSWILESDFPADWKDITVSPIGPFHLLFLTKHDNNSDTVDVYLYHTVTKRWTKEGGIYYASATFKSILVTDGQMRVIIAGEDGEISDLKLTAINEVIKLNSLDYITLIVFFVVLYFFGHYFSGRKIQYGKGSW